MILRVHARSLMYGMRVRSIPANFSLSLPPLSLECLGDPRPRRGQEVDPVKRGVCIAFASGSSLRKLIQESVRAVFVRVIPRSGPWRKMTSTSLVPVEGPDFKATLDSLGKNFNLDAQVLDALLKSRIQNLEEFRFLFEDEGKIEPFLAKIPLGEDRLVQGARLRRAWTAVSLFYKQADQDRSKVTTSDLDTMLGDVELRDVKTAFWQRYRMRFPPDIHPADATLSRVSRELTKRMLCVFNVGKVKTLQYQLHTTQKKRKLADNLWMEAAEEEEETTPRDWEGYMDRLHTLMLAYSMAGIAALSTTGSATSDNQLGADSSAFIQVPLDITRQYYFRAKRQSSLLPHGQRLTWLEARDVEERSEWVAKFRESTRSLGAIIKEVYTARDAHWVPPATTTPSLNKPAAGQDPWQGAELPIPVPAGRTHPGPFSGQGDEGRYQDLPRFPAQAMQRSQDRLPQWCSPLWSSVAGRAILWSPRPWRFGVQSEDQGLTKPCRRSGGIACRVA